MNGRLVCRNDNLMGKKHQSQLQLKGHSPISGRTTPTAMSSTKDPTVVAHILKSSSIVIMLMACCIRRNPARRPPSLETFYEEPVEK